MNIINPYNESEHRVYNRSFLHNVQVGLEFDTCKGKLADTETLNDFISEYFNIKTTDQHVPESVSRIELNDQDKQVRVIFTENSATATVEADCYRSFTDTMLPLASRLIAYAEKVCNIKSISTIGIQKKNTWKIVADNGRTIKEIYPAALRHTFNEQHITDMASMALPDEPAFRICKEADMNIGEGVMKAALAAEIKNNQVLYFNLDLNASAWNVGAAEAIEVLTKLNNIIYCAFHDIVSDNIITMMKEKGDINDSHIL